jgi:hypothetical protein
MVTFSATARARLRGALGLTKRVLGESTRTQKAERSWFDGAKPGDTVEFYLPGRYLNFIIANGVVVTAQFSRAGMPDSQRTTDRLARAALESAFPGRQILQVDVLLCSTMEAVCTATRGINRLQLPLSGELARPTDR